MNRGDISRIVIKTGNGATADAKWRLGFINIPVAALRFASGGLTGKRDDYEKNDQGSIPNFVYRCFLARKPSFLI